MTTHRHAILWDRTRSSEEVERAVIEELERALKDARRERLPAGSILIREGESLDGIYIRLSGEISLNRRVHGEDVMFHTHTAGPIIGMMSLSEGSDALYTCRAETEVEAIRVSFDQLDEALRGSPALAEHFPSMLLRSLARRNRRALELRMEVEDLNRRLAGERDRLTAALDRLEKAHLRLVESEKMATLGQLVAGLGHELNNPVAAIARAAEFAVADLEALLSDGREGGLSKAFVERGRTHPALSSREARARREALAAALGDARLAARLVKMGVYTPEEAHEVLGGAGRAAADARLRELELSYRLGQSLQNVRACAGRIAGLVASLRSYGRADSRVVRGVDVLEGLEETLSLLAHAMRGIELTREYETLPAIEAVPGEINQVWTNIVTNAIQAMDGRGRLRVEAAPADDGRAVRVTVEDSGPGVRPDHLDRIFEVNFTTKLGRAEYGIGLGLPICRAIVERHGGRIEAESNPGRTRFSVTLPVRQARDEGATEAGETVEEGDGGE